MSSNLHPPQWNQVQKVLPDVSVDQSEQPNFYQPQYSNRSGSSYAVSTLPIMPDWLRYSYIAIKFITLFSVFFFSVSCFDHRRS